MSNFSNSSLKLPEDFSEWDSLPEKAYDLIFSQSKDRFEECLSESESITNKSIKFIIALITFIAAFVAAIICYKISSGIIIVIASLGLLDIILWAKLIFPKSIIPRGQTHLKCLIPILIRRILPNKKK